MPKNEDHFFRALNVAVGSTHIKSKSLGTKVSASDVFLDKNFENYEFPDSVKLLLKELNIDLCSTGSPGSGSLAHFVDGLFSNHPVYGTRIVEFDEEQHFSLFRAATLRRLSVFWGEEYLPHYAEHCGRADCFNRMLNKHRLKVTIDSVPESIKSFIELVQANAKPNNSYVRMTRGFEFVGGRVAQRALYDTLRDVAHLSPKNSLFSKPFRCSIFEFETEAGIGFLGILQSDLQRMLKERLKILC